MGQYGSIMEKSASNTANKRKKKKTTLVQKINERLSPLIYFSFYFKCLFSRVDLEYIVATSQENSGGQL